ncbi:MAG: hypothetical protein Q3971_05555 [Moraxella sp.]|nr:hypothetical protein [Moraxella sp.]
MIDETFNRIPIGLILKKSTILENMATPSANKSIIVADFTKPLVSFEYSIDFIVFSRNLSPSTKLCTIEFA